MKHWVFWVSIALTVSAAQAQDCDGPVDAIGLALCHETVAVAARAEMRTALAALTQEHHDAAALAALRAEQTGWEADTEAQCRAMASDWRDDPVGTVLYHDCWQLRIYARAAALLERQP